MNNKLSVTDLVALFEDSEDATLQSRKDAERDRDYVDNKQLTSQQKATLRKRGQPDDIFNEIKRRHKFMIGVEKQQKVDPVALPNTPLHEDDAKAATMALRYVADAEDYDSKRGAIWSNMLVEGAGGIDIRIEQGYDGQPYVKLQQIAWDRAFWDPHSAMPDYSDATYIGTITWMDYSDALEEYPDGQEILDATLSTANPRDTYDDKPKFKVWADRQRKRIRICQIWVKRGDQWHWAEYTRGGILRGGPSPYKTDKGESDCGLRFQSAYIDRDNNRYGDVRELIGPQNAVNKARQKSLHLLNTAQVVFRRGSVQDIERFRREAAKPDGTLEVDGNPANPLNHDIQFNTRTDLAAAHVNLMQLDLSRFDVMGPNATMMGEQTGGSQAASGKAIIASQQGGMMTLAPLLDNLRHLDIQVYRAIWYRIRQYWTAEKWVRVTDDDKNIKWIGMNVNPQMIQMAQQQNPEIAQRMAGAIGNVAELDCDINIDDAPDSLTPALEQFQAMVELKQYDTQNELPFRAILRAAPNLRDKEQIFKEMDEHQAAMGQQAQMKLELEVKNALAKIADLEAMVGLHKAQTVKAIAEAQRGPDGGNIEQPEDPRLVEMELAERAAKVQDMTAQTPYKVADTAAATQLKHTQAMKTALEARLMPAKMAQEAKDSERDAKINEMKAKQKPAPRAA